MADNEAPALILGESGTGRTWVARAIHWASRHADAPLIKVACTGLLGERFEEELFRVASSGQSRGGSLLLEDVADLSQVSQVVLLRLLQDHVYEPPGSGKPLPVELRVIATTNRDLETAVSDGQFRQDLYYKLNVLPLRMPLLRERKEDLPVLVQRLAGQYAAQHEKAIHAIDGAAMSALLRYDWPGNFRELETYIQRAVLLATDGVIHFDALPEHLQTGQ